MTFRRSLALGSSLTLFSCTVFAQSSVTLYGLLDVAVRYTTNQTANGKGLVQMTEGPLTGNRWGIRGVEDIGGGTRILFVLESGFLLPNGTSLQGGRLFGRYSYVGIQGAAGTLTLGRQYTVLHEMVSSYDAMALSNYPVIGFQGGNYTGNRQDNMAKYTVTYSGVTLSAQHAFGNVAGSFTSNASDGVSLAYAQTGWRVGGAYQVIRDLTQFYGLTVAPSLQHVWTVGGTYAIPSGTLYLGYTNSRIDNADYSNQAVDVGVSYFVTPFAQFITTITGDHLKHAGDSGNRITGAVMLDYYLSKATDIYAETDYTRLGGAWVTLAAQPTFATPFYGKNNEFGVALGLRHRF